MVAVAVAVDPPVVDAGIYACVHKLVTASLALGHGLARDATSSLP